MASIVASKKPLKLQQLFLIKSTDMAPHSSLILAFMATKLGWLVAWTFAPKLPPMA